MGGGRAGSVEADHVWRRSKRRGRTVFDEGLHSPGPDGGGAGYAGGYTRHGGVVIVADPGGNQEILGIAKSPVVAQIIGGAGLDRDVFARQVEDRV